MNKDRLSVSLFGLFSGLLGSLGTLLGGIWFGVAVAVVVAVGYWLYFQLSSRKAKVASPANSSSPAVAIPEDRIDSLTGLANGNGLAAWFVETHHQVASEAKELVVLTAELDDWNSVKRSRGGEVTDLILKEVANRVSGQVGPAGISARISETEFVSVSWVKREGSLESAAEQAGRLAEMLQRPAELRTGVVWIGGSVGAATGSPLASASILENSRSAMARAKRLGRGHFYVHASAPGP